MPAAVYITRPAQRQLRALPPEVQTHVRTALDTLAANPLPSGSRKIVGTENTYRIRIGDYRVVYTLDEAASTVMVTRVGHRRDVYRGL